MSSIGYYIGRTAVWVAVFVTLNSPSNPDLSVNVEDVPEIPAAFEESAFDLELYHHLNEPYQSYQCMPRRIHLSQESDVDSSSHINLTVSFTLDFHNCKNAKPFVLYGRGFTREKQATAESQHFNYTSARTGEFFESDFIYHVKLTNLKAGNKRYWYRIRVKEENGPSTNIRMARKLRQEDQIVAEAPIYYFFTPPNPGSPTSMAFIGDLGQTINSTRTMAHIQYATRPIVSRNPVSIVMIVGDMSYADGEPKRWTHWLELMEPLFRSTPMEVAAGNHEIECDNVTLDVFIQYENYFHNANRLGKAVTKAVDPNYRKTLWNNDCSTPSQFEGHYDFGNAFYAFRHGLVQMIVLSSYSETQSGSPQYQFLESALQSVNRTLTPWLIVNFHCPFYTTFIGHLNETQSQQMRMNMEPLFIDYGVNLVFSGHDHGYLRTHPMSYGKSDPNGKSPIYFIVGAGGNREQHARAYLQEEPEEWVAVRDRFEYGFGHLLVPNATHARFKWVRDGTTDAGAHDNVWLENKHALSVETLNLV